MTTVEALARPAVRRRALDPLSALGIAAIAALVLTGAVAVATGSWDGLVAAATRPALHVGDVPTSWLEVVGFTTGLGTVLLVVRGHVANWPIGIANTIALCALFLDAGLFADGGLQVVYVVLGLYGWWAWLWDGRDGGRRTELEVSRTTGQQWVLLAAAVASTTAVLWWVLASHTSSVVPAWDALTTAISLGATGGQTRKKVESWWLWITVDVLYVPLYAYKELYLTAVLYVAFLGLCVLGLRSWRRQLATASERAAV